MLPQYRVEEISKLQKCVFSEDATTIEYGMLRISQLITDKGVTLAPDRELLARLCLFAKQNKEPGLRIAGLRLLA